MSGYKRKSLLFCFLLSMFFVGCGSNVEKENTTQDEVEETITSKPVEESEPQPEETAEEVSSENSEKVIWDDLDGNGEQEYFIITNEENGILSLYFNNELIYQYEDQYLRIVGISEKEYIDLDHDGEPEIFVSFIPNVNSMPLMEWFALRKGESGWELMEMYHENDDMTQNAFPVSIVLKEKDFELSITCEGCDKEIIYDATNHYEQKKEEEKDCYDTFVGSNFEVGDEVGSTSAWGIWNIESGMYEGRNCLIAEHGLQGPNGKYDFHGHLDVYFCYDEKGKINILDIVFREDIINTVMAEEAPQRLAFGKVLWDAYQRGILPDGRELDYVGMEAAANNSFAITDIDYDGQEELLLYWDYASMAGTVGFIFGYDDGEIHVELLEFPRFIFYDNGIVEAGWSHNQGLAGEFWPYNVYMYDAKNDVYQSYGVVDAWDKSVREENYEGEPFPTDIDVDGNGIVYYIFPANWDGQYEGVPLVDDSDYENWCSTYLDGAEQIDISFQQLTEENIAALGYPKPDIQLPQPVG